MPIMKPHERGAERTVTTATKDVESVTLVIEGQSIIDILLRVNAEESRAAAENTTTTVLEPGR